MWSAYGMEDLRGEKQNYNMVGSERESKNGCRERYLGEESADAGGPAYRKYFRQTSFLFLC